jgi:FkbM family methyltransferase
MNLFRKAVLALKVVGTVRNWPDYFRDLFGAVRTRTFILILRNGQSFVLRSGTADRGILHEVWALKEYPFPADAAGGDVVDIGAQIGIFACYAAHNGARVFAYEPEEANYALLLENVRRNGLERNIRPFRLAVSDRKKSLPLYLNEKNTGGHSAVFKSGKKVKAQAVSLNDVFSENGIRHCALLKMDTEGSEYPILYGASDDVLRRITHIQMEWHPVDGKRGYTVDALTAFLKGKGFEVRITRKPNYLYAERKKKV